MTLTESLKWRYATKQFDSRKKISENDLAELKEVISLTATSYGLQAYKVVVIESQEIKEQLKPASWNQSQVEDCSHVFVFCNYTKVRNTDIDGYVTLKSVTQGVEPEKLSGYADFMKRTIGNFSGEELENWTSRQTYIALGNLLMACAELRIDACPMEGFDADQYSNILGLSDKGLSAAVIAAVGYRSAEDQSQHLSKIRKPEEELFVMV